MLFGLPVSPENSHVRRRLAEGSLGSLQLGYPNIFPCNSDTQMNKHDWMAPHASDSSGDFIDGRPGVGWGSWCQNIL